MHSGHRPTEIRRPKSASSRVHRRPSGARQRPPVRDTVQCQEHGEEEEKSHTDGQKGSHPDGHPAPSTESSAPAAPDGGQNGKQPKVGTTFPSHTSVFHSPSHHKDGKVNDNGQFLRRCYV